VSREAPLQAPKALRFRSPTLVCDALDIWRESLERYRGGSAYREEGERAWGLRCTAVEREQTARG
jgi:hypothetical protein